MACCDKVKQGIRIGITKQKPAQKRRFEKGKPYKHRELAEREGFEPSIRETRIPDFESGAFDHSATFPRFSAVAANSDEGRFYQNDGVIVLIYCFLGLIFLVGIQLWLQRERVKHIFCLIPYLRLHLYKQILRLLEIAGHHGLH